MNYIGIQNNNIVAFGSNIDEIREQTLLMNNVNISTAEDDYVKVDGCWITKEQLVEQRKKLFYSQFIATSLGNYRLQPKGYANAQQAMDVTNTMATALGGLTEQLTALVIFYPTPDFTKEEQCTEEWLVENQITPDIMTLGEWQKFYMEFCQLYSQTMYKLSVNKG